MFLVCGEALYDVFIGAESASALHLDARPGGSPFNVAIGLARLGQSVSFLGGLSTDLLGERLLRVLAREGVATDLVVRFPAPTTLGLVGLRDDGVPQYAFYGHGAADRLLGDDRLPELDASIAAIHIGSFSTVVEPVGAALEALVRRECGTRLIAYDPNVRPSVEPALERWRAKIDALKANVHILKISAEDFGLLYPNAAPDVLARQWLAGGTGLVVMTRGAHGAVAWTCAGQVEVPGVPVQVADTVGAGDTFQAALLARLAETGCLAATRVAALDRDAVAALLAFAMRAASITCSRRGADLPRRAELG